MGIFRHAAALVLLALLLAPFGRMAVAEAMAMPHAAAATAGGHCDEMPADDEGDRAPRTVDCLTACAVMVPPPSPAAGAAGPAAAGFDPPAPAAFAGLRPEAEPPPPRRF